MARSGGAVCRKRELPCRPSRSRTYREARGNCLPVARRHLAGDRPRGRRAHTRERGGPALPVLRMVRQEDDQGAPGRVRQRLAPQRLARLKRSSASLTPSTSMWTAPARFAYVGDGIDSSAQGGAGSRLSDEAGNSTCLRDQAEVLLQPEAQVDHGPVLHLRRSARGVPGATRSRRAGSRDGVAPARACRGGGDSLRALQERGCEDPAKAPEDSCPQPTVDGKLSVKRTRGASALPRRTAEPHFSFALIWADGFSRGWAGSFPPR